MKKITPSILGIVLAGMLALIVNSAHADTFGRGRTTFTIPFLPNANAHYLHSQTRCPASCFLPAIITPICVPDALATVADINKGPCERVGLAD